MADTFSVADLAAALKTKEFPTVMLWNRLEGRPRTGNFLRALRAEVRDALWMVTRQWQVGEFRGEDAGSPVFAKVQVASTPFSRFQAGGTPAVDFDRSIPLETQVEQQPLRLTIGSDRVAFDLRIMMGRRWLALIAGIGNYGSLFINKYKFNPPDPAQASDAAVCAHPEVWQTAAAVAGRAVDGALLYQYLTGAAGRHAYDGITVLDTHKVDLDTAAEKFVAWVERTIARPAGRENPAWQPSRLEYRFACSAATPNGEKVYVADEYHQGTLDWHGLDIDPAAASLGTAAVAEDGTTIDPVATIARTMIPVPVSYPGMPHPRWWTIEDGRTNFGEIKPDTTDLAKLLFMEFGLVYSNDWFIVPFTMPGGSVAAVQGLSVSNVFGERFWIEAAGSGADDNWQRWSMYTVNKRGLATAAADPSLLLLPTVPKVQEGKPLEEVLLLRDEMANMVWGIEKTIPAPDGRGRSGGTSGRETRAYFERLVAAAGSMATATLLENDAKIRYDVMSSVPEHWIPFIPVRAQGTQRAIELQRAALPRIIEGDSAPPVRVRPRTSLLRSGLDQANPQPFFVPEEEVPRAGARVTVAFQRTRWLDGRVVVWSGARKQTGRGEGSSGLAFDRLADKEG
jgi:hypothetical protein